MLRYFRNDGKGGVRELNYEEALGIVLGTYKDNDMTRDMLTVPNWIPCRFSTIAVKEEKDGRMMTLMPGYVCDVPHGNEYDEEGNRL